MKPQILKWTAAVALASVALGTVAHAQSADALIDKLVDKGILSVKEANELREEADKGFTQAYQVKSGMPDWVNSLRINGDFRGRYEAFFADNDTFSDRYRWRYRLRVGMVATLKDQFEVGLRLTSSEPASGGSGGDPISGNSTFQDNASKKFLYIDQAYAKWTPVNQQYWGMGLTIGKMENPFLFSDMVFDGDYTPEGAAVQFNYNLSDKHVLKLNGGAFILDELGADSNDPWMAGAQLRWDAAWTKKLASTMGVAMVGISNPEQLTPAAVPNQNRGNTRTPVVAGAGGTLVFNYNPIVVDGSLTYTLESFPMYNGAFPIKLSADYMNNPGADPDATDNDGYSIGIQFGKAGKKKTYDLGYTYKYLGADAWYEEVVDSDFGALYEAAPPGGSAGYGAGTNTKGHIVKASYSPYDSLTLSAKWFRTELINGSPDGSDSVMNRVQVDALLKF
jgi:hypothetical protein